MKNESPENLGQQKERLEDFTLGNLQRMAEKDLRGAHMIVEQIRRIPSSERQVTDEEIEGLLNDYPLDK